MIRVLVLGCTGSIGVQALQVIEAAPDMTCCGLACGSRVDEMEAQARAHGVAHTSHSGGARDHGDLMDASEPDVVLNGIVGAAGLPPTLAALERGLPVALANKESLVVGGELVNGGPRPHRRGARAGRLGALGAVPAPGGRPARAGRGRRPHRLGRPLPRQGGR